MVYSCSQKGMIHVDVQVTDLYKLPNISQYADLDLLTLSENCAALEEQVYQIAKDLPDNKRQLIEAYINIRNDLEVETFKTALRWGKLHYK